MKHFGAYRTQLVCGFGTSLLTVLTPFVVANLPFWCLVGCRVIQGIPLCNLYPVVGEIVTKWSKKEERGTFVGILTGYLQLSCLIAMPLAGVLTEFVGWPSAFYGLGALNAIFFLCWGIYYRDDPQRHPFMFRSEQRELLANKVERPPTPYVRLFTTPSVIVIYVAVIGNFITFNFANTFFPLFLHSTVGMAPLLAGIVPSIALLCQFVVKFATGIICDRLPNSTELSKIRWSNSISFCGAAIFFVIYEMIPSEWSIASIVALCFPFVILGANAGGFPKSAILVSGPFTPTVLAVLQIFLCGSFLLGSAVVPSLTPNGTREEFLFLFRFYTILLILTNGLFVGFCGAKPPSWVDSNIFS